MKQTKITYNLAGLEKLKEQVGDIYRARVGILGGKVERDKGPIDNVTLGIIQMFGSQSRGIPPRDFLLLPIETKRREIVKAMSAPMVLAAIQNGDIKCVFELLGASALAAVQEAFETHGFGQWAPNAPSTIRQKGSDSPLIDDGELRRAITSDVVKKSNAQTAIAQVG